MMITTIETELDNLECTLAQIQDIAFLKPKPHWQEEVLSGLIDYFAAQYSDFIRFEFSATKVLPHLETIQEIQKQVPIWFPDDPDKPPVFHRIRATHKLIDDRLSKFRKEMMIPLKTQLKDLKDSMDQISKENRASKGGPVSDDQMVEFYFQLKNFRQCTQKIFSCI